MISVDDDPGVSRAVQRDLRRRYGERFRVLRAESGAEGLELLAQVKLRDESVALVVADQRMPRMNGVEFLEKARELVPDAKRVLLTAYADTQAAIDAINRVALDHYLMKPWDPPEEQLYPVLDDLLSDWQAGIVGEDGIRVVGHRYSRESHQLKDFLARNNVPYRWFDAETSPEARPLMEAAGADPENLPLLVFPDGEVLVAPSNLEVAEQVGLHDPGRPAVLRPGRGGRRPGGARRRRVRGIGGSAHGAGGARRAGRSGRAELPHRELPGLPRRPVGQRPHPPGNRAGAALRGPDCSRCRTRSAWRPGARRVSCTWTAARRSRRTPW